jgi:outer membrane protein TolC
MRDPSGGRLIPIVLLGLGVAFAVPAAAQTPTTIEMKGAPLGMPRLTLGEAVQRALAQNVSVVVALEEIRRYEALRREARAASFPTLVGNGVYTRLDADRTFGGRVILYQDQLSANLSLTVPLIVPQRWASWSHASANVKTAQVAAEDARRQTAIAVARAFLGVITQKHVVDVNEHALQTARAHYDFAHTRLLGGIGNRIDDVRAEQQVATNQSQLETSYVALARAREGLGVLVGDQGPIDAIEDIPLPAAPTLEVALDEATKKRPDVVASRLRFEAADQVRKDSYTDYLPFLLGNVQPFYQSPESLTQPKTGWQAQLLLTVPLYDGGLRYGLAAERQSLSLEARAQYEALLRQARSDVRVAFEAVKQAEAAYASAVAAARLAHGAVDLVTTAYRAGATTNIEVIDAERAAHAADTAAALAEDQAGQARIDLLAASSRFP